MHDAEYSLRDVYRWPSDMENDSPAVVLRPRSMLIGCNMFEKSEGNEKERRNSWLARRCVGEDQI